MIVAKDMTDFSRNYCWRYIQYSIYR